MSLLYRVNAMELDDVERVLLLQTWERCSRWVAAQQCRAVVAVAGVKASDRDDFAREHVRVALRGCGGSPRANVDIARALSGALLGARDALEAGVMSYDHVRALVRETRELDPLTAREVSDRVIPKATRQTPAEFARTVRRAVIAADPLLAQMRAERIGEEREVSRQHLPDAQALLSATGPAVDVATIWTALDVRAAARGEGGAAGSAGSSTLAKRRFDALVEICAESLAAAGSTGTPTSRRSGVRPTVFIFADALTWAGLADGPADLEGYGPIPAGIAREHFTDSTWRAVVTDAVHSTVVGVADSSYVPSPRLRRHLFARDRRCGFPGCGAAVWFCDADHNLAHADGGCTDLDNCGLLCRRHHRLKTFTRWEWRRRPDGTIEWTDPQGHVWCREPVRYPLPPPEKPPPPLPTETTFSVNLFEPPF